MDRYSNTPDRDQRGRFVSEDQHENERNGRRYRDEDDRRSDQRLLSILQPEFMMKTIGVPAAGTRTMIIGKTTAEVAGVVGRPGGACGSGTKGLG